MIVGDSITQGSSGDYTWPYRLYEHLRDTTKEGNTPTLEDLAPLYQAIPHGSRAQTQPKTQYETHGHNQYTIGRDRLLRRERRLDQTLLLRGLADWALLPVANRANLAKLEGILTLEDPLKAFRKAPKEEI